MNPSLHNILSQFKQNEYNIFIATASSIGLPHIDTAESIYQKESDLYIRGFLANISFNNLWENKRFCTVIHNKTAGYQVFGEIIDIRDITDPEHHASPFFEIRMRPESAAVFNVVPAEKELSLV